MVKFSVYLNRHVFLMYSCFSGSYCPEGSPAPVPCSLGQYCDTDELDAPTGNCTAGYFCAGGEVAPNPVECNLGHYCPAGTTIEVACAPGTFNSKYCPFVCV